MSDEINQEWKEYLESLDSRISTMWNFILYNRFTDEKVEKYKKEVRDLNFNIKKLRDKNNNLNSKNTKQFNTIKDLERENLVLNNKIKNLDDSLKYEKENSKKRSREEFENNDKKEDNEESWLEQVKSKKPKLYKGLDVKERDQELLKEFEKLNSIGDIINLKENNRLYDFLGCEKFDKIYNLIPSLEKLDKMVGMKKLKEQIFSMICYCLHQMNSDEDLNHIVLMGPPGVGKTTVAHLLGDIYRNLGFLSKKTFIKARRSDLIAKYLGQTAIKTQKLIDQAEGGVLFIDEVYSLGNSEKRDSYAKECIDTINQNLTEKAKNLLVIIAGYKREVKECFFSCNPGLERRFPLQFDIEKYDADELYEILEKIINFENWKLDDKVSIYLKKIIKKNYKLFEYMGGDMQMLFKFSKENYSIRLMKTLLTLDSPKELVVDDFKYAIERFKINRQKEELPDYVRGLYV